MNAPTPAPEPVAEAPPKPKAPPKPGRPRAGGNAMGLDDLFGGGAMEGRVRIGRRAKPKPASTDDSDSPTG